MKRTPIVILVTSHLLDNQVLDEFEQLYSHGAQILVCCDFCDSDHIKNLSRAILRRGIPSVTLLAADGGSVLTTNWERKGFFKIEEVSGVLFRHLIDRRFVPIVSPTGIDRTANYRPVSPAHLAIYLSEAVGAHQLVILGTDPLFKQSSHSLSPLEISGRDAVALVGDHISPKYQTHFLLGLEFLENSGQRLLFYQLNSGASLLDFFQKKGNPGHLFFSSEYEDEVEASENLNP